MKNINLIIKNILPNKISKINKINPKQISWKLSKTQRNAKKTWKINNKKK